MSAINTDGSSDLMELENILSHFDPRIVNFWRSLVTSEDLHLYRLWHKDFYYILLMKKSYMLAERRLAIFIPFYKQKHIFHEGHMISEENMLRYLNMKAFW